MKSLKIISLSVVVISFSIWAMENSPSISTRTCVALIDAAYDGDLQRVKTCIAQGVYLDFKYNGDTALTCAARRNHLPVVQYLLEVGAPIDQFSIYEEDKTPLMWAVEKGHKTIVEYLLESGANPNLANRINNHRAHSFAIKHCRPEILRCLIQYGADITLDGCGYTPLSRAVYYGTPTCAKIIVERLLQIPSDQQKESWYAFLIAIKRRTGLSGLVISNIFKSHLLGLIEQENREFPRRSVAYREVMNLDLNLPRETSTSSYYARATSSYHARMKDFLLATFWPQTQSKCTIL